MKTKKWHYLVLVLAFAFCVFSIYNLFKSRQNCQTALDHSVSPGKYLSIIDQLHKISECLREYQQETGICPHSETWKQELLSKYTTQGSLIDDPNIFIDPWGSEIRLKVDKRKENERGWYIYSLGPNKVDEEGYADDLTVDPINYVLDQRIKTGKDGKN